MSMPTNTYLPSDLVSLDIMHLLGNMDSVILRCAGKTHTSTFDEKEYVPGMTVAYQVAGVPPVNRGQELRLSPYEQRTLFIKADVQRWYFSVSHSFNQTDDLFYMNRKLISETISAPTLKALKETIELEGAQWAKEHSPVIPSYGAEIDKEILLPSSFDYTVINYLEKLRRDLIFPTNSYKLVLNTRDDMLLANSLQNMFNEKINRLVTESGAPPSRVAGFSNECSAYLGLHLTKLEGKDTQGKTIKGPLSFVSYPISDEQPEAILQNNSSVDITLTGGDILYHKAQEGQTQEAKGLYWIQNTVKRAIPDSRYAFCVTSDKYIADLDIEKIKTFKYTDVEYTIPAGKQATVSLSHKPIFSGYHQNCSREIITQGKENADQFYVLGNHFKNHALHPEYFKFKCFKLPHIKGTEHAEVSEGKTGIKMLISHDGDLHTKQNIFDVSALPCFGSVSQNLFTLPVGDSSQLTDNISLIGKKKK
jgi:hypothetical protein